MEIGGQHMVLILIVSITYIDCPKKKIITYIVLQHKLAILPNGVKSPVSISLAHKIVAALHIHFISLKKRRKTRHLLRRQHQ